MGEYEEELLNYKREWTIQRLRGNKLHLFRIPINIKIQENYSMFRITYEDFRNLLSKGSWNLIDLDEYITESISLDKNSELEKLFSSMARNHSSKNTTNFTKRVITNVPGTSCLLRTSTKSSIQIAYRKNNNKTQINRVCISDRDREEFFEDCRNTNDPLALTYYKIRCGYRYFDKWNKYMDKEYQRQIQQ